MANLGFPVRVKFIPSLAYRLTLHRPASARPSKPPHPNWTLAFRKRHPELQVKMVKALDWNRHDKNIYPKITRWFEVIGEVLRDPAILAENVDNMDETGVMLSMLRSIKVFVGKDDKRNYRGARVKRTTVTAIECISADGRYLNPMIIWPATTHRTNWTTFPTPGWHYACSESGYTDSYISLQWLKRIFDPETGERADGKPRVLICNGFGTHETLEILEFCLDSNIILCRLPSHTSHKLQPCDVSVFAPLKDAYREQFERLERGGVNTIGKQHFTSLYSRARADAFTPRNIRAGFSACGLFPFNPDRVRGIPKPQEDQVLLSASSNSQEIVQPPLTPITPVTPLTPVTTEGLVSLQNIIVNKDAQDLDERSKCSLQNHLDRISKAAHLAFSRGILQRDQIKFLMQVNDEAKVRKATQSIVLAKGKGEGKVMGFEDLEEARRKRAEQKALQEAKGKGKCGRKNKDSLEDKEAEEERHEAGASSAAKRGRKRKATSDIERVQAKIATQSEALDENILGGGTERDELVTEWRAPEAPMLHNRFA
ncbi:transposase [Paraphaeosphaeria minitans]|uniref:Transposase n=1 Tax=Paraphaeosphaeria minitans TaxID=565426 RepID=A0A9P6KKA9_9PLEO|nr:transposase [Paraphaeosphaeria minitans]